jgi:hypothetical protein
VGLLCLNPFVKALNRAKARQKLPQQYPSLDLTNLVELFKVVLDFIKTTLYSNPHAEVFTNSALLLF